MGVFAEQRPARTVVRTPGETDIAFDEPGASVDVDSVPGLGVVETAGDAEAVVELVVQMVGGDPLIAPLGAAVLTPLELAPPLGRHRTATAAQTDRTAVDLIGTRVAVERRVLQRKAQVPTGARVEIHAEGMGQAGFGGRLEELALVEQVDLVRQAPTLAQRPAWIEAIGEQGIVRTAVGRKGVDAVDRVIGLQAIFGVDLRRVAAIAAGELGADAGQIAEQVLATDGVGIVVGVLAT